MHFVVFATDRAGCLAVREAARPAHRAYLRSLNKYSVRVVLAGPTFSNSGTGMNGTMLVLDADSIQEVADFVAGDPYSKAGLFEKIDIRMWLCGLAVKEPVHQMCAISES